MEAEIEHIPDGSITSPSGFKCGATSAGIKENSGGKLDLGILISEVSCTAAGVFTNSRIKAAPVVLSQQRLSSGRAQAIVVNSGCANAYTGENGLADAVEMADLAARFAGVKPEDVIVASTGVTGNCLPMARIKAGIGKITLSKDGGHDLARAIMTTDTVPKEVAVKSQIDGKEFVIGGIAKGSGMIHPDMATLLCFLTTDAAVDAGFLRLALKRAVDISFNMVSVDGDTSPNDTVVILANGKAGNVPVSEGSTQADVFEQVLEKVCIHLAKCIARDGEGAEKLIVVTVDGAISVVEARLAARTIVNSPLVKAAVHGNDPNWGRVIAAIARSGVEVEESKIDLYIGGIGILKAGNKLPYIEEEVINKLRNGEVTIDLSLGLGMAIATAWGCDLSEEYVTINSQYTT